MKLPTNKKERIQILVLIGAGAVAVLYALVSLAILPMIASFKSSTLRLTEKRDRLELIDRALKQKERRQTEFDGVSNNIPMYSEKYVLRPKLGSYLIVVRENLESLASACGLQLEPAAEVGRSEVPGKNADGSKRSLLTYGVRVSATGGYNELLRFFRALERQNSMVCITELAVLPRASNPEAHTINATIQGPIWGEPEKPAAARDIAASTIQKLFDFVMVSVVVTSGRWESNPRLKLGKLSFYH